MNTLELNISYRHDKGEIKRSTECSICKAGEENIAHFILECEALKKE